MCMSWVVKAGEERRASHVTSLFHETGYTGEIAKEGNLRQNSEVTTSGQLCTGRQLPQGVTWVL